MPTLSSRCGVCHPGRPIYQFSRVRFWVRQYTSKKVVSTVHVKKVVLTVNVKKVVSTVNVKKVPFLIKNPKRCARVDFPPTGLYEQSFGLIPLHSYSFSSFRFLSKSSKRCARVDFPPTGLYEQSFGLIPLDSYSFSSFRFYQKVQTDPIDIDGYIASYGLKSTYK